MCSGYSLKCDLTSQLASRPAPPPPHRWLSSRVWGLKGAHSPPTLSHSLQLSPSLQTASLATANEWGRWVPSGGPYRRFKGVRGLMPLLARGGGASNPHEALYVCHVHAAILHVGSSAAALMLHVRASWIPLPLSPSPLSPSPPLPLSPLPLSPSPPLPPLPLSWCVLSPSPCLLGLSHPPPSDFSGRESTLLLPSSPRALFPPPSLGYLSLSWSDERGAVLCPAPCMPFTCTFSFLRFDALVCKAAERRQEERRGEERRGEERRGEERRREERRRGGGGGSARMVQGD